MMAPPSSSPTSGCAEGSVTLDSGGGNDASGVAAATPKNGGGRPSLGGGGGGKGSTAATPSRATPGRTPGGKPPPPQPPGNNYAAPNTPIASAKRPRTPATGKKTPGSKTPSRTPGGKTPSRQTPGGRGSSMTSIHEVDSAESAISPDAVAASSVPPPAADEEKENIENASDSPRAPVAAAGKRAASTGAAAATGAAAGGEAEAPPTPAAEAVSPMHPPRPMRSHDENEQRGGEEEGSGGGGGGSNGGGGGWAGKLFSPVLNFLGGNGNDVDEEDEVDDGMEEDGTGTGTGTEKGGAAGRAAGKEDAGAEEKMPEAAGRRTSAMDEDGDVRMEDIEEGGAESALAAAAAASGTDAEAAAEGNGKVIRYATGRTIYESHTHEKTTKTTVTYSPEGSSPSHSSIASSAGASLDRSVDLDASVDRSVDRSVDSVDTANQSVDVSSASAEDSEEEEEEEEFNPYLFIKSLPSYSLVVPPPSSRGGGGRGGSSGSGGSRICLPPKDPGSPPIALVLDLDETLVHCTVEPIPDADMVFPVVFNGIEYRVHVRCRPYLEEFLRRVSKEFEVIVFTASQRVYADELLNRIDPERKFIKHRMFRESCLPVEGNYLKDLNVLGRDLRRAVLVDNSPHAFGYQVDNGIPIESWFDDPHDTELLKLERFLRTLHGKEDVRRVVREKFQTYKLVAEA